MAAIDTLLPYLLQDRAIPDRFRKDFINLIKQIDKKTDDEKSAEEWFVQGYMAASQEQYDEAEDCFSDAIRLNKTFEAAWKHRGDMKLASGATKYAIEDYSKAIAIDTTYAAAYLKRAQAFLESDQADKAQADLDMVTSMDTNAPEVLLLAGSVFEKQGKIEDALQAYSSALANDPKNTQILNARALVYLFNDQAAFAKVDLMRIQAIEGSNFVNAFNLGLAYGQLEGEYKETFQQFDRAFKKNPDLLKNYFTSAAETEKKRLKKTLQAILKKIKAVKQDQPGAFYRSELITLLERKMADVP